MKTHSFLATCSLMLLSLLLGSSTQAQPRLQEVLGDALIIENPECAKVVINFNVKVRYKKHFPPRSGEEVRIQLEPIVFTEDERQAVQHQESLVPPQSEIADIDQITYEGDDIDGAFLVLTFNHPVSYMVEQGKGFNSIEVTVFLPSATVPCAP